MSFIGLHVDRNYSYFERTVKQWTPYDGDRVETPGHRCVVWDGKDFTRDRRVFAYVEVRRHCLDKQILTFVAWHELPLAGETKDVHDGIYRTQAEARRAAIAGCLRDVSSVYEAKRRT